MPTRTQTLYAVSVPSRWDNRVANRYLREVRRYEAVPNTNAAPWMCTLAGEAVALRMPKVLREVRHPSLYRRLELLSGSPEGADARRHVEFPGSACLEQAVQVQVVQTALNFLPTWRGHLQQQWRTSRPLQQVVAEPLVNLAEGMRKERATKGLGATPTLMNESEGVSGPPQIPEALSPSPSLPLHDASQNKHVFLAKTDSWQQLRTLMPSMQGRPCMESAGVAQRLQD